jgi:hypothetical protein
MALADLFKRSYVGQVYCNNCYTHTEIQIPKGTTLSQFIEGNKGKCPVCGCNTLIADYKQIDEFRERSSQPKMQILRPRVAVSKQAPLPELRPSMKEKRYQPLPQSEELPDFSIPKDYPVDFWTGERNERRFERKKRRRGDLNENY